MPVVYPIAIRTMSSRPFELRFRLPALFETPAAHLESGHISTPCQAIRHSSGSPGCHPRAQFCGIILSLRPGELPEDR